LVPWSLRPHLDADVELSWKHRVRAIPEEAMAAGTRLVHGILADVPQKLLPAADRVRRATEDRFQEEVRALAYRASTTERVLSWRDVVLANVTYDLRVSGLACSTLAAATADGPVLARNMDWWPVDLLARATYAARGRRQGSTEWVAATWPGAIGVVTGMSARGFAVAVNAVRCGEPVRLDSYPVLLHVRRVIEDAVDFDQALDWLQHEELAAPGIFVLVGRENHQRVVVERTPSRAALRWPERPDAPLVATNDYRALGRGGGGEQGLHGLQETACERYDGLLEQSLEVEIGHSLRDEQLLALLGRSDVFSEVTAQQVVMRPRTGGYLVAVPSYLLDESGP
jgi:hypothetical protein